MSRVPTEAAMEGASASSLYSHFPSSALSKIPYPQSQKAHPPFSGPFHASIPSARISTYNPGEEKKNWIFAICSAY